MRATHICLHPVCFIDTTHVWTISDAIADATTLSVLTRTIAERNKRAARHEESRDIKGEADYSAALSSVVRSLLAKYDLDDNDKIDLEEFKQLYPVLRFNSESTEE